MPPFYTQSAQGKIKGRASGGLHLTVPPASPNIDFSQGAVLFSTTIESADSVPSWEMQEMSVGQEFVQGDVPAGNRVRAVIDGQPIPCQVSNRTFWSDGSLKLAQIRLQIPPVILPSTSKTITWERVAGDWTAHDAPLHPSPAAVTSKVALDFEFVSWKGRDSANALTAEKGPKTFRSAAMLAGTNSPWIDTIMAGPLCCEWRASDFAFLPDNTTQDTNFGAFLYARAWGGTAGNPKRIQFLFRTIQGWSTDIPSDEQGSQVSINVRVNGGVIRGSAKGTAGWTDVKTWKGGFILSADTDGLMDWYDVATGTWVVPPKLVYRRNVAYGVKSKFIPPVDTSNSAFPMNAGTTSYLPAKRGPLRAIQDDVADHAMLSWTGSKPMFWNIASHARGTSAQIAGHQKYARAAAFGMGAMTGLGFHRTTRKIISYLPPAKQTNQAALGTSIYGGAKPANAAAAVRNGEITNLDAAHFPQMAFWPAFTEGDQHLLDLAYHEATLPGLFEVADYGFYGSSTVTGMGTVQFGGLSYRGQIRAVGHCARPMGNALSIGNPADPHWVMCRDYLDHWCEMTERIVYEQDAWRGGLTRTDGRRFQDIKALWPNNEPTYKTWMHTIGLGAMAHNYGMSEYEKLKTRVEWFSYIPTVMAGGWADDGDYLMRPDPFEAGAYHSVCMDGLSPALPYPNVAGASNSTSEYRRYWKFGQWAGGPSTCIYKADGQTIEMGGPAFGATTMLDGMVMTVSAWRGGEPHWGDGTKMPPVGLTPGIVYYSVQSSGNNCKLSTSINGAPVTFTPKDGVDQAGHIFRRPVAGVHPLRTGADVTVDANGYIVQVIASLDMVQHYVLPNDHRVRLARKNLSTLKKTSAAPNAWDERGKMVVPGTPSAFSVGFTGGFF